MNQTMLRTVGRGSTGRRMTGRRMTGRRAALAASALVAGLFGAVLSPSLSPAVAAAGEDGYDVSWPQCRTDQGGYALPMPPDSARFVVIGLTSGMPFTSNPCLGDEVNWAASRHIPAQAYTMAGFPTPDQLAAEQGNGPWQPLTRWAKLANVGYSQGRQTLAQLAPSGFAPHHIWIDVEPRKQAPWPTGSDTAEAENRALLTGLARAIDESGHSYGFYSNASGWSAITGNWRAPGVPTWATVGKRTRAEAVTACGAASFSSGPVHLAQWWDATRDYDVTCAAYRADAAIPYPPNRPNDLLGDWQDALIARQASTGTLWRYTFNKPRTSIGTGWNGRDILDTVDDLSGDGVSDLIARRTGSDTLTLYPRTASGSWGAGRSLGTGWAGMDRIIGVGDITGDTVPDLIAREKSTGRLWLAPGAAGGGLGARVALGTGWNAFNVIVGAGDLTGDGIGDLLARKSDGTLWRYRGNGAGGWAGSTLIGTGWAGFDAFAVPGDLTGDGAPDLLAREKATGVLWMYPTDGAAGWRPRVRLGTGWAGMNLFS